MYLNAVAARQSCARSWLHRHLVLASPRVSVLGRPCFHTSARLRDESSGTVEKDDTAKEAEESMNKAPAAAHVQNKEFMKHLAEYKKYFHFPPQATKQQIKALKIGDTFTINGFLERRRFKHSKLAFADIISDYVPDIQVVSALTNSDESTPQAVRAHGHLRRIVLHSPVSVTGTVTGMRSIPVHPDPRIIQIELKLLSIQPLNTFPKDVIVSKGARYKPSARHLQLRFDEVLRHRLTFRNSATRLCRNLLHTVGFQEFETPMLFKSTPEGAREFLVPTRRKGFAFALPQSPQQYKQLLMASGFYRYFQFARCFRDEDLRTDRQPEFTQLDLEMAFATGEDVMRMVEDMVTKLVARLFNVQFKVEEIDGERVPVLRMHQPPALRRSGFTLADNDGSKTKAWPRITYEEAMAKYGSDKPDLRIPFEIQRIDPSILPQSFVSMITDLQDPIVEAIKFRPATNTEASNTEASNTEASNTGASNTEASNTGASNTEASNTEASNTEASNTESSNTEDKRSFIVGFMDSLPPAVLKNPDGSPALLIFDSSKPMSGLASLGHEGFANLTALEGFSDLADGDIIIMQARRNAPFHGGSTALGNIRTALYADAVSKGLLPRNDEFKFLWVTEFPLFTPDADKEADEGQRGAAGFSATHHPFTAPLTDADLDLLATDPLRARADHYDLVVNGVELGGGSRRIHVAKVQEYVMRDILRMTDAGVAQFEHLLRALRAGCPPHAGFAMGWDRFVAVLSGTSSVRDVIAFPKSMKGEDMFVRAPGQVTREQLDTYHLKLKEYKPKEVEKAKVAAWEKAKVAVEAEKTEVAEEVEKVEKADVAEEVEKVQVAEEVEKVEVAEEAAKVEVAEEAAKVELAEEAAKVEVAEQAAQAEAERAEAISNNQEAEKSEEGAGKNEKA